MMLIVGSVWLMGCAPNLKETYDWSNEVYEEDESFIMDTGLDGGTLSVTQVVNATDRNDWVYLDMETGEVFPLENPVDSSDWDLGFRRFVVQINSPLNGPSDVGVQINTVDEFEVFETIPSNGFLQDIEDINDDGVPEYVFNDWFDYEIEGHILTPKPHFYVVRNRNQRFFKLRFEDYYSSAGTPAMIRLTWTEIF